MDINEKKNPEIEDESELYLVFCEPTSAAGPCGVLTSPPADDDNVKVVEQVQFLPTGTTVLDAIVCTNTMACIALDPEVPSSSATEKARNLTGKNLF